MGGGALSSCGGGSGSGAISLEDLNIEIPYIPCFFCDDYRADDSRLRFLDATARSSISNRAVTLSMPKNEPTPGFANVHQSTNQDGGATSDDIFFEADLRGNGTLVLIHVNGDEPSWDMEIPGVIPGAGGAGHPSFWREDAGNNSSVYAAATMRTSRGNSGGDAFRFSHANNDWLAAGVWMQVPNDRNAFADFDLGAWAGAGDLVTTPVDSGAITDTRYRGQVNGFLVGANSLLGFTGTVELRANFGASRSGAGVNPMSILGTLHASTNVQTDTLTGLQVRFHEASIESGAFVGSIDTTGSRAEWANITGTWGGNFAGSGEDIPTNAIGTFGGKDAAGGEVLIGTFLTECSSGCR